MKKRIIVSVLMANVMLVGGTVLASNHEGSLPAVLLPGHKSINVAAIKPFEARYDVHMAASLNRKVAEVEMKLEHGKKAHKLTQVTKKGDYAGNKEELKLCSKTLKAVHKTASYGEGWSYAIDYQDGKAVCTSDSKMEYKKEKAGKDKAGKGKAEKSDQPAEIALQSPLFDPLGLALVFASMPLEKDAVMQVPHVNLDGDAVAMAKAKVTGTERVAMGGGKYLEGWKVEVKYDKETETLVVCNEAPYLIKRRFPGGYWKLAAE